jgi:hypothetical protein
MIKSQTASEAASREEGFDETVVAARRRRIGNLGFIEGVGVLTLDLSPIVVTLAMNGFRRGAALLNSHGIRVARLPAISIPVNLARGRRPAVRDANHPVQPRRPCRVMALSDRWAVAGVNE